MELKWAMNLATLSLLSAAMMSVADVIQHPSTQIVLPWQNGTFNCRVTGHIPGVMINGTPLQALDQYKGVTVSITIVRQNASDERENYGIDTFDYEIHITSVLEYNGTNISCLAVTTATNVCVSDTAWLIVTGPPLAPQPEWDTFKTRSGRIMWDKPFSIVNISHYKVEVYSKGNRVISNSSLTANHGTEYYTLEVVDVYDGSCLPVVVCVSAANTVGLSPAGCVSDSALPNRDDVILGPEVSLLSAAVKLETSHVLVVFSMSVMNGFCGPSLPVGYTVTLKDVSCADNYCTDIHLINSSMTKLHNDSDKESTAIELPFPPNPNRDDVLPVINKEYDVSVMIEFNAEISKLLSNITIYTTDVQYANGSFSDLEKVLSVSCHFAEGSNARGCQVALTLMSKHSAQPVKPLSFNVPRKEDDRMTTGFTELPLPIMCYDIKVFDWESDYSVGTIAVPFAWTGTYSSGELGSCNTSNETESVHSAVLVGSIAAAGAVVLISVLLLTALGIALYFRSVKRNHTTGETELLEKSKIEH